MSLTQENLSEMLSSCHDFWAYWGFTIWKHANLSGVRRKQRIVKKGFLGTVAEFYVWDYIIWDTGTEPGRTALWHALKPEKEVMTQRFLFVMPERLKLKPMRSFLFGFKGYAEFYHCWPTSLEQLEKMHPADLTGLLKMAIEVAQARMEARQLACAVSDDTIS